MATSQNGWVVGENRAALGVVSDFRPAGVLIAGGVRGGDVAAVLGYVAEQFHRRVEPLVAGACWGHAYRAVRGQTSGFSNHASGTAMDLNAPQHPLGARGTFTASQVREIRAILGETGGVVRWGGDYSGRPDEMHFEINAEAAAVAAAARRITTHPTPPSEEDTLSVADAFKGVQQYFDATFKNPNGSGTTTLGTQILYSDARADGLVTRIVPPIVAAIASDPDVDVATVGRLLDESIARHTPTAGQNAAAVIPLLRQAAREVASEDNRALADQIVDEMAARLTGTEAGQ